VTKGPIPILLYHSVSTRPAAAIAPFSVTPAEFGRQLDLIADGGYQVLTVSDLVDKLTKDEALPLRAAVLTFDDGFADTLEVAVPMLAARRLTATVYLTTGYLAGGAHERGPVLPGRMMTWRQIRRLELAGLEVGAHSHTHPHLDILPSPQARAEVQRSKRLLEDHLGHAVRSFAYPHGYASSSLRREIRAAGFDSACGVRNQLSHPADDRWCLARLTIRADTPLNRVAAWLRGEGAPLAGSEERLRTRAWREVRRLRHFVSDLTGQA
jgi:peptidoglycan/xylan/chitin deacetylase (PgdA/CDA1 family)